MAPFYGHGGHRSARRPAPCPQSAKGGESPAYTSSTDYADTAEHASGLNDELEQKIRSRGLIGPAELQRAARRCQKSQDRQQQAAHVNPQGPGQGRPWAPTPHIVRGGRCCHTSQRLEGAEHVALEVFVVLQANTHADESR